MSANHMAMVLAHSRAEAVTRLVALALANSYDTESDRAVASTSTVCRDARATREQVTRAVARLVKLGEWQVVEERPGVLSLRMLLGCPIDCDRTAMHRCEWDDALEAGAA